MCAGLEASCRRNSKLLAKSALLLPQTPDLSFHPLRGQHPSSPRRPLPRILTFAAPGSVPRSAFFLRSRDPSAPPNKTKHASFQRQRLAPSSCSQGEPRVSKRNTWPVPLGQERGVEVTVQPPRAQDLPLGCPPRWAGWGDSGTVPPYLAPHTMV